ncbi:MAG: hypothetical protein JO264_17810, partial [Acidisphaera sp.]|nr:hypothetical protein [Acidisphaera sp.]
GIDAALNSGPVDYFFSGDQYIRVTRGDAGPGTVDAGYPAPISNWGWKNFGTNGIKAALFSGVDFTDAAQAPATLASNSNYVMSDSGKNLTNVEVTVDFTQDMVVAKNGPPQAGASSVSGFTVQLNCFSPTKEADAWQQYVIGFDGGSLYGQINNWKDVIPFKALINQVYGLTSTPSGKVPIGYKLRIVLQNDSKDNVSGVVFEVRNDDGKVIGSHTQTLTSIGGVSSADIAPIVAYQVVVVGPGNSESATFSSGAGTIIMQGSQAVTPNSGEPSDSEVTWGTAETANSTYTRLLSTAGPYFAQSFGIDKTVTAVPTTPRKLLHPLPAPGRIPVAA